MEINPVVIDLNVNTVQPVIEVNLNPVPIKGDNGKSAYEVAIDNGFVGSEQEWLDSLKPDAIELSSIEWNSTNW